ncbi:TNF receptor-associated factor 6-like [Rhipicephalus sanguineus]|uniref:TNF receptor-associated factor 6-like n=1 Tax=Rhipicephalus sanguineus TaxID=34632 RepID=UPI0020C43A0E|nr:TNF receptor-associated factor 6-like [Rhipicephalus sanguineus]
MMALANQQYTLVGFTEDLDWNPLQFVKPLPRNKLCSVCGLVRKTTANLPCGHVACCVCLEQCKTADGYACPIDGENCLEEHVDWRDFPTENLLKREVKCWNQRLGCPLMMAASDVHKHFHRECEYHCTFCPRCSAVVLCRDMGEHLRASCNAHAAPQETECVEKLSDTIEKVISTVVRSVVQEQAGEMKALLQQVVRDNGAVNDSLTEVCQSVNVLKESVKREIAGEVSKQTREVCQCVNSLKETLSKGIAPVGQISEVTHRVLDGINTLHGTLNSEMADIKKQNAEELPRVRAAIESVKEDAGASMKTILEIQKKALAYAEKNEGRCEFFVSGIESLEAEALKDDFPSYYYEKVYLRGYSISPGVQLSRNGKCVFLSPLFTLHRGEHDDVILWPFQHKMKFAILHPFKNAQKEEILQTNRTFVNNDKRTYSRIMPFGFTDRFKLEELKADGYVCNDKLRVVVELL